MTRIAALALCILISTPAVAADIPATVEEVCFTPGGDCTGTIVDQIGAARREVLVQAYSFTSPPIAEALVAAHKRGVRVVAVLDKSQRTERYSGADFLANQGVEVRIDARHAIAHNKVMILDGERVITGSFNFTRSAQERNAENLLVLRSRDLAARYADNWRGHYAHAEPYVGKLAKASAAR